MHTAGEAQLLARLAQGRRTAVEIGTYEGSSAVVLARAIRADATLHLVDAYEGNALKFGWRGTARATQRLMERETRNGGPTVRWHVMRSEEAARRWSDGPIDLLFIDGDHTEAGCRADWEAWSPHVGDGGVVAFHDARAGHEGGGQFWPGPTAVVDSLFRGERRLAGWRILDEVDSVVAVERAYAEEGPGIEG